MSLPNVLILRAPGTNCDVESAFAFEKAGATTQLVHVNELRERPRLLRDSQILMLPGGFSYGDDVASGKILATQLQHFLYEAIREFRNQEKLILGVCNGFQTLLKAGLLVPPDEDGPLATLTHNSNGRYEDRWVELQVMPTTSPFFKDVARMYLPIAHAEGKFICKKEWILQGLSQSKQIVLRYVAPERGEAVYPHNPNGSQGDVAGLCDATGRVLGLMPHPERNILPTHHPRWTREGLKKEGDGLKLFRNAVEYFA